MTDLIKSNFFSLAMIELLECGAVVEYTRRTTPRLATVALKMGEDELERAFEGKALLGGIVDDITSLWE